MKTSFLKDIAKQLASIAPEQMGAFKKDFEKNCHHILMNAFNSLEVVTREEFDAQTKVLARTRKKLETLEAQLDALEDQIINKQK